MADNPLIRTIGLVGTAKTFIPKPTDDLILEFDTLDYVEVVLLFPEENFQQTQTYNYDFTINWGDGSGEESSTTFGQFSHFYAVDGLYQVVISGSFGAIQVIEADAP